MNWDIDREMESLEAVFVEKGRAPGTNLMRIHVDIPTLEAEGWGPTLEEREKGSALLWVLGVGASQKQRIFFRGRTIAEAVRKAKEGAAR
jgi:hypothetical protein